MLKEELYDRAEAIMKKADKMKRNEKLTKNEIASFGNLIADAEERLFVTWFLTDRSTLFTTAILILFLHISSYFLFPLYVSIDHSPILFLFIFINIYPYNHIPSKKNPSFLFFFFFFSKVISNTMTLIKVGKLI